MFSLARNACVVTSGGGLCGACILMHFFKLPTGVLPNSSVNFTVDGRVVVHAVVLLVVIAGVVIIT